jgi:hypothetical protein
MVALFRRTEQCADELQLLQFTSDDVLTSVSGGSLSFWGTDPFVGVEGEAEGSRILIVLIGRDRLGLLSEVLAVLTNLSAALQRPMCRRMANEWWRWCT